MNREYKYEKGQEWGLVDSRLGKEHPKLVYVQSVTPGGKASIGGELYRINGDRVHRPSGTWDFRPYLVPVTPEIRVAHAHAKLEDHVRNLFGLKAWSLTDDQLSAIQAILQENSRC